MTAEGLSGDGFRGPDISVRDEWLDYNGHVTDSAYAVICALGNEALLDHLGVGADYFARTGCSTFTVESHLRYLAEVGHDATLSTVSVLVAADAKRLRMHTRVRYGDSEVLTGEYLFLHVDRSTSRVTPFPPDRAAVISAVLDEHAAVPRPPHLGLGVTTPAPE